MRWVLSDGKFKPSSRDDKCKLSSHRNLLTEFQKNSKSILLIDTWFPEMENPEWKK